MNILIYVPKELLLLIGSLLDASSGYSLSKTSTSLKICADNNKTKVSILVDIIRNSYVDLYRWFVPNNGNHKYSANYKRKVCEFAAKSSSFEILQIICDDNKGNNHIYNSRDHTILHEAIRIGRLDIVQYLCDKGCCLNSTAGCSIAAKHGHFEILKYLRSKGCDWSQVAYMRAAENGHFDILQYLCKDEYDSLDEDGYVFKRNSLICAYAAKAGRLDILKWLRGIGCRWDESTCIYATKAGHFGILKWAHENGCPWNTTACTEAAGLERLDVLKYLIENGCPWDEAVYIRAAGNGRLDNIKFLKGLGHIDPNEYAVSAAMLSKHFEIFTYLRERGCPWGVTTIVAAIENNDFENVKYLHQNGCPWNEQACPWDEQACTRAALQGSFDILKYLVENGCPMDADTFAGAIENSDMEIIKYLRIHECPWSEESFMAAIVKDDLVVIRYLHENKCPWSETIYRDTIAHGTLDILKYLHQNGCPQCEDPCKSAAKSGCIESLVWLCEQTNSTPTPETLLEAVNVGHYDMIEYLLAHNCPMDLEKCIYTAKRRGNQHILKILNIKLSESV